MIAHTSIWNLLNSLGIISLPALNTAKRNMLVENCIHQGFVGLLGEFLCPLLDKTVNLSLPFSLICFHICVTRHLLLSAFVCSSHKKHPAALQELDSRKLLKANLKGYVHCHRCFRPTANPMKTFFASKRTGSAVESCPKLIWIAE